MYALKVRFKGKGQAEWSETILRDRFEKREYAEAVASEMRSRGAIITVIIV
jgi:hypothetical protein